MNHTHLFFNTSIGVQKPENIRNKNQSCPFCAREELTGIIDVEGPILLLKNKYPVLENAYQTVLVETDVCDEEFSQYSTAHLNRLLEFAIRHWTRMEESGEFRSVVLFKNHGSLSGGTIAHSHMQIVGLHDIDYHEKIAEADFQGLSIHEENGVQLNLSDRPKVGFYEFNITMDQGSPSSAFASLIQTAVHYIMNSFPFRCSSYNLFFYSFKGKMICKVVPRFVTTPLFIGYQLPQVPNNLEWMKNDVQSRYFQGTLEKEA
jgi:ATP adenylyltransferase/5',5'''-P-1,P-4-tetraphosphate phosphorylase II